MGTGRADGRVAIGTPRDTVSQEIKNLKLNKIQQSLQFILQILSSR